MLDNLLSLQFYNNTGRDYLTAIIIFIVVLVVLKAIETTVIARLKKLAKKTKTDVDDVAIDILSKVRPPFYLFLSLYLAIQTLFLPEIWQNVVRVLFVITLVYELINALQTIVEYVALKALKKEKGDEEAKSTIKTLSIIVKIVLWSLGLVLILANIGVNVTSLIAGLGVGGIAIALAMQNILSDVFSSFSILIDKPFQVGDLIKVGDDVGTVEKIGIKTTRLRTLNGEILIIANQELTTARVQNFKQMKKRRAQFTLGVIYETDKKKLQGIPKMIEEMVMKEELVEFDRCHFKDFGDFSLNFETVFYVKTKDYKEYRDVVERVNLDIFDRFNKEKIEFAYPTSVEFHRSLEE